jgi:hypothetical protein
MSRLLTNNSGKVLVDDGNALAVSGYVRMYVPSTRYQGYIDTTGKWVGSSDSYTIKIQVTKGVSYRMRWTTTSSSLVGTIFRWGFTDSTTAPNSQQLDSWVRTTPQDTSSATATATKKYIIIQFSASYAAGLLSNGRFILEASI